MESGSKRTTKIVQRLRGSLIGTTGSGRLRQTMDKAIPLKSAVGRLAGRIRTRLDRKDESSVAAAAPPYGVNVAGYFASEKGVGEAVRSDIRSLRAAGVPHALNHFVDRHGSANRVTGFGTTTQHSPYRFNLVHVNPDQVHVFAGGQPADYFEGRYNIGFWVWELSDFPHRWLSCFRYFDEIWVPSTFVQDSVARVSPVPVVRFPHSVVTSRNGPRTWDRSNLEIPDNAFVFLFMFDFYSVLERKNPFGLVDAFRRAFDPHENAWLVLKCSHPEHDPDGSAELHRAIADANVRLVDRILDPEDVGALMATSDCYVSLHRSEGFGITVAEAMAHDKPVVVTAYGGNTDFTTPSNSLPVRYRLRELDQDFGPYERGCVWAEPDLDHAARQMRFVFDHPSDTRELAQRGRADVERWLAPASVGRMMARRLRLVDERTDRIG